MTDREERAVEVKEWRKAFVKVIIVLSVIFIAMSINA